MRPSVVEVIARREYLARVKTKGYWLATIILPLFMAAMIFLPSLLIMKSRGTHRMAIVDETGQVGTQLVAELTRREAETEPAKGGRQLEQMQKKSEREQRAQFEVELVPPGADRVAQRAALDARLLAGEIDSWIRIGPESIEKSAVEYRAESVSNFLTQRRLEDALSEVVGRSRLEAAGLDAQKVGELTKEVELDTVRVSAEGSRAEAGMAGFFLAYFLFFLLYMVVAIYGAQVMNGVIEEKTSRVVEVVLSTVKPFELMLGKLFGIGLAGLTQLAIWLGAMLALTSPALIGALAWVSSDNLPQVAPAVVVHFLLHFLLGFFFFATLYAAIGSACNNVQEAQQFAGVVVVFLVAPAVMMVPVINDPDSTMAVVLSLIPPLTPLLMMLRIAVKMPPLWQILLGYVLSASFTTFLVWVCSRIYRVGILMYGKKPTFRELWRWLRYA